MRPPRRSSLALREFLESLEPQAAGRRRPCASGDFNKVLQRAKALPVADLVNEVVLRSQSQAVYAAENLGHFGLNLQRYAHFTSPIRRYADLIVHRSLIRALGLGAGGIDGRRGRAPAGHRAGRSPTPSGAPWQPSARPPTG